MIFMQITLLLLIGATGGILVMATLFMSRSLKSDNLLDVMDEYGISVIRLEAGGWMCSSGVPRQSVGAVSTTPRRALESAVLELEEYL